MGQVVLLFTIIYSALTESYSHAPHEFLNQSPEAANPLEASGNSLETEGFDFDAEGAWRLFLENGGQDAYNIIAGTRTFIPR